MTHTDESRLLARLDGELSGDDRARVEEHLRECPECRERSQAVERRIELFSRAVERLDVTPPRVRWSDVRDRTGSRPGPGRFAPILKAAAVILVVTGVASAVPGSPVDDWIGAAVDEVAGWLGGGDRAAVEAEMEVPETTEAREAATGVAVRLDAGAVRVSLDELPEGTEVRVRLVSGDQAVVEAGGARYRTAPGRIQATGASGGPVSVRIPRDATAARVLVNGTPAVALEDGRLRVILDADAEPDTAVTFRTPGP